MFRLADQPRPTRISIAAAIKRATFQAHRAVEKLDARALKDLQALYKQAAGEITDQIALHAGADGNLALQELQSALAQLNGILKQLGEQRDALLQGSLESAADLGVKPYGGAMGATGAVTAVLTPAAGMQVANDALNFVRTFVAADGLQLSDRIWRLDRGARDVVVNAIEQAVIQGHGAAQAAREFLARGQPVPVAVRDKVDAASARGISKQVTGQLLTGVGNPMDNAMRLFRTEINRAHGEAYMRGGESVQGFAGWRFLLSPAHPKPDICDLLSTQNLYGLGPGVYPKRERTPWPAHPNTLSFIEIVFEHEITAADRAGRETPMQAMGRLTDEQRKGVLGSGKLDLYNQGKISQGMIRTPLSKVKARVGNVLPPPTPLVPPPAPEPPPKPKPRAKPAPKTPALKTLDDYIGWGDTRRAALMKKARDAQGFQRELLADLAASRPIGTAAKLVSRGRGAQFVEQASLRFPDDWTKAADRLGPLSVQFMPGRASYGPSPDGSGAIRTRDITSAVHEYTHRLQHALPKLDDFFQEIHQRRTTGEPIRPLRYLIPGSGYAIREVAQKDQYVNAYQGRIYRDPGHVYLGQHGALEVMTMAFEALLGDHPVKLQEMLDRDREMLNLAIGLLYRYAP